MRPVARGRSARLNSALALLLLSQAALGMLRIQIVPLGSNVDEIIHFAHAKLVAAACLRDSVGLSWSLHRDDSERGEDVTTWIAFSEYDLLKIDPGSPENGPCDLLFDRRRLLNSAYYLWAGLPMAVFNNLSDRATINMGRAATLLLGLATTAMAYSTARRLFPGRSGLPISVASLMALNQHLGDVTTGINSDAGAVFAVSLLFWTLAETRGLRVTAGRGLAMLAALLLCLFVKSTAWIGLPVAALWLWVNLPSAGRRWALFGVVVAGISLAGIFLPVSWDVPAHWFVRDAGETEQCQGGSCVRFNPAKVQQKDAPVGESALLVASGESPSGLVQHLPESSLAKLRGKTVTVGGWIHAPSGGEIKFPNFATSSGGFSEITVGNGEWQFRAVVVQVPSQATHLAVTLPAAHGTGAPTLYDGLVLVSGEYPTDVPPSFSSPDAQTGEWGRAGEFSNLMRNASAETMWPRVEVRHLFGLSTNRPLWSLLSWQRTSRVWLRELPGWLFTMYWSGFGGTQPGLSRWQLWPFLGMTLLAGFGMLRGLFLLRLPWRPKVRFSAEALRTAWLLVASAGMIWLMVILRADIYPHRALMFTFAGTRYGLPAMLPGSILFTLGWMQLLPTRLHRATVAGLALLLFLVSVHILIRVQIRFYECPLSPATLCLSTIW
ncbi:MAG: hypothetical protein QF690_03595 [Anaerolineales bacterium]|nr:hypothetical protein [Anaerolineales bacterium]